MQLAAQCWTKMIGWVSSSQISLFSPSITTKRKNRIFFTKRCRRINNLCIDENISCIWIWLKISQKGGFELGRGYVLLCSEWFGMGKSSIPTRHVLMADMERSHKYERQKRIKRISNKHPGSTLDMALGRSIVITR